MNLKTSILLIVISLFAVANLAIADTKNYYYGDDYNYDNDYDYSTTDDSINNTATATIGDVTATATIGDVTATGGKGGQGGTATAIGANENIVDVDTVVKNDIVNTTIIPAPIMPIPGFISPTGNTSTTWTSSPFDLGKNDFTIAELCRLANPSRVCLLLWREWDKNFQIEMSCWDKAKSQKSIRVYSYGTSVIGYTKMGEAHARAVELHKSEIQVAAALCVYAAKQGAKVVVIHTFSNPVTKADSAVFGGAGASLTGNGDIVNSAGGFGWTTAEKVYRSYVVAELYR